MSEQPSALGRRLRDTVEWVGDREDDFLHLNFDAWFRDPEILSSLGPALSSLFASAAPTVIVGPTASGYLLGPRVAEMFGVGFVRVKKNPASGADSDRWRTRTAPPDYQDRNLVLGWRHGLVSEGDRVLAVDDVADTGSQLAVIRDLVRDIGATWLGAAVLVDSLESSQTRRDLELRAVVHVRDL